jgi:hypothetical protein
LLLDRNGFDFGVFKTFFTTTAVRRCSLVSTVTDCVP